MTEFRNELQGVAALHTTLAKMDGHGIDKKAARFSAMADYMEHVGACSSPFSKEAALASLSDAVSTAIIGDPMHIEKTPFDRLAYKWAEADQ